MAVQIQLRRGTALEWSTTNPVLAIAEMAVEIDTDLFKIGNGFDAWNDLPYGGVQGYVGSAGYTGSIGNIAVANVLYVSKSGNDSDDGRSLNTSKLTIKSALEIATTSTTIFVKSGDYVEQNPLVVPEDVAIFGDNLRTVTVRPANKDQDLFWVRNGSYLTQMTFKDHEFPTAAVAFPPDGSAGVIFQSPYVQNCTSLTTTGAGMRVDGALTGGTKSMVLDAYTQYNQGGIGIHLLNNGYAQLVSLFTICCEKAILCETGGNCSVTNSNSSFGTFGLYADGVSEPLYSGVVKGTTTTSAVILIDNLVQRPSIGDAVKFDGDTNFYTVESATSLLPGSTSTITGPNFTNQPALNKNVRSLVLDNKSNIQIETINFINETYLDLEYNQGKCSRDIGFIIDAVVDDMVLGTNYKTVLAGTAYYRGTSSVVTATQKLETIAAINYVKNEVLARVVPLASTSTDIYTALEYNFETIINILGNGPGVAPTLAFPNPANVDPDKEKAKDLLQTNKQFLIEEGIAFISANFPYNQVKCARDTGLIVDTISLDMLYNSTSESVFAGLQYWNQGATSIPGEVTTTTAAINYLKTLAVSTATAASNNTIGITVEALFTTITNIITSGTVGVTDNIVSNGIASTNSDVINAYDALLAEKNNYAVLVNQWVTDNHPTFVYDSIKCARDVTYIIDSVAFDLLHGGNKQSIKSGVYYYTFDGNQSAIEYETTQTTAAYNYISSIIPSIVTAQALTATYQSVVSQNISLPPATSSESTVLQSKISTITNIILNGPSVAATKEPINLNKNSSADVSNAYDLMIANREFIKAETIAYLNQVVFTPFNYDQVKCRRDIGYIIDAVTYDTIYGGNSQTIDAADEYYSSGVLQVPLGTKRATWETFDYIGDVAGLCVQDILVTAINTTTLQSQTLSSPSSAAEGQKISDLFDIVADLIENGYSSIVTLEEVLSNLADNTAVTFHQFSLITASGHTFEWVGAGININTALPSLGGIPIQENQVVQVNGGRVYFTSTDQKGDFRIGNDFVINRKSGTITGRTFTKSLFVTITPYILALGR